MGKEEIDKEEKKKMWQEYQDENREIDRKISDLIKEKDKLYYKFKRKRELKQ